MQLKTSALVIGIAIGVASGLATANVNDRMNEMFGTQSNVTRPGVAEGAMRGVVTGGNMQLRSPIVQPGGFSFDPPKLGAGCGGIDLYGGNLSFPSKEQYIATARAVIANIGGYAFRSALSYVSEKSEAIMSAIQDTVNLLNMENMSSCQIAMGIKDGTFASAISESADKASQSWLTATGQKKDSFEAQNPGPGKDRANKEASKDPQMASLMQGNWVWESMRKTEVFNWLGTDRKTREEVMSLIGTVITCTPGVGECEGEGTELQVKVLLPKLRLQDFVAVDAQVGGKVRMYSCFDEDCLKVSESAERTLGKSVTQRITDALLGKDGQPGVLERLNQSGAEAGKLSESDRLLISKIPEVVAPAVACLNMGTEGRGHAERIVNGLTPVVAADALYRATDQSLQTIMADLASRTQSAGALQAAEQLAKSRVELTRQRDEIYKATEAHDMLLDSIRRCGRSPIALASSVIGAN